MKNVVFIALCLLTLCLKSQTISKINHTYWRLDKYNESRFAKTDTLRLRSVADLKSVKRGFTFEADSSFIESIEDMKSEVSLYQSNPEYNAPQSLLREVKRIVTAANYL